MTAQHLVFFVEDQSSEAFLRSLLPRVVPDQCGFEIHSFQGKSDLLGKLEARLRAYATWLPDGWRLVVLLDRDEEDCRVLKQRLEAISQRVRLRSKTRASTTAWQIVNRLAIEELEAWYFSDWLAVRDAFPRVSANIPAKQAFRDSDGIAGGTWEAFERVMQRNGYFASGLRKVELARTIGQRFDPAKSSSRSFKHFHEAVLEALA